MIQDDKQVVIVGAGLVGSLLAALLAERGHRVRVYEGRVDPRRSGQSAGRSINLVLTRRGLRALERVGLAERALGLTVPVTGRMMHSVTGELTYQPYGKDDSECNYSIPRGGLNDFLIDEAEHRGVDFRFGTPLVDAELAGGRLVLQDAASGEQHEVEAPIVFGTDGAGSIVRKVLNRRDEFDESVEMLEHGYKELTIPAGPDGEFIIERRALHIWPRGELMLMALPNRDGSFTVTLYLPYRGRHGFDAIETAAQVSSLFEEFFADAVPLIPDLPRTYLANPTGELGIVRCHPWHHDDRVLLLGDAAHAIVPFFGQGMNAGFEDCTVLAELLDEHGDNSWRRVFSGLSERRKPHADAIADMALDNFVEMRDRVADREFLLRKQVEHRLEQEIPAEYRSRYSMVMYSHIPYRSCMEAGEIQQRLLDELCDGLHSADELDMAWARQRIAARLTPFLSERGIRLDY